MAKITKFYSLNKLRKSYNCYTYFINMRNDKNKTKQTNVKFYFY